ncbi:MAG: hypothetical protein ICV84_15590 [Flavisolibacter sp.]|nr:hypothetical protein [Flavisolibacter sp.]
MLTREAVPPFSFEALSASKENIKPMLDFYLVKDESPSPKSSAGLELAGRLSEPAFEELQSQQVIESRFDYYTDFRWSSHQVRQKVDALMKRQSDPRKQPNQSDSEAILLTILEKAVGNQSGLVAYAD